jgi:diguanylate cyclase (GGDEF)-like protein/PAS domain S-box-containing protein
MENHPPDASDILREWKIGYHALFEGLSDAVLLLRGDRVVDCNPKALSLFGCAREELLGCRPGDLSPGVQPDGVPSEEVIRQRLAAVMRGEPQGFEWQHRGREGTPVSTEVSLFRIEDTSPPLIQAIIRDVTDRKIAGDLYRIMARNSPIGVYVLLDGKFAYVNRSFRKLTGYEKNELLGRSSLEIVHPEDRERVARCARAMLRGERTEPYEFRVCAKGRRPSWNMETVAPITFRGRRAVLGNFMDVTRQKLVEEALRESEERYRTIVEDIADGYFEVDLAGRFTYVNHRICEMLGSSLEETLKMNYLQYTDEVQARRVFEAFNTVYRTGAPCRGLEWEVVRKDGTKGIGEASVSLVRDVEGKPVGFRGIVRDTTERKRMEEQILCLAFEDALTGLPNRRAFMERFAQEIARAGRHGRKFMIAMMDLDRFKEVNDTLGHQVGDRLLRAVADRLRAILRKEDTLGRLGGDEFAVLIPDVATKQDGVRIGEKFVEAFQSPFPVSPHDIGMTTSIGFSVYPDDGDNEDALYKNADHALYRAKDRGRNTYVICGI